MRINSSVLAPLLLSGLLHASALNAADVAVIMSANVDAYHEALQGFKQTVKHRVVAEFDMEGDFDRGRRIIQEIRSEVKPELVLAVGLWALQLVSNERLDIPVVFTMVLNPESVLEGMAGNITGASMNVPVKRSLQLLKQLNPNLRRVGVIYDKNKTGYLVDAARAVAPDVDLQLISLEVDSAKQAIQAANALYKEGVDAFWILPDDTVLDPKVIEYTLLLSYRNKIPLLGLSERQAQMGALLSLSFGSSKDIGRQAGELTNVIMLGTRPRDLPFTTARSVKLTVNLKAAQKLGVTIPESILASADSVIR